MTEERRYPNKPITLDRMEYIQDCAKAAARRAIETGDTSELTPLSSAYHYVYKYGRPDESKLTRSSLPSSGLGLL
jgi:hypothetical protein